MTPTPLRIRILTALELQPMTIRQLSQCLSASRSNIERWIAFLRDWKAIRLHRREGLTKFWRTTPKAREIEQVVVPTNAGLEPARYHPPILGTLNLLADEATKSLLKQSGQHGQAMLDRYTAKGMRRIMRRVVKDVLYAHWCMRMRHHREDLVEMNTVPGTRPCELNLHQAAVALGNAINNSGHGDFDANSEVWDALEKMLPLVGLKLKGT